MFLGVDGGGTKTEFVLIDQQGAVRASCSAGTSYYLEIGMDGTRELLRDGIENVLRQAGIDARAIRYAFFGLPAYGEDSSVQASIDSLPDTVLNADQYRVGSDMICSWAGSLACTDGVSVICGTGSMGYGEYQGRGARAGGWGELFSDEGSAYWIAREGLSLFSKMSDGRIDRGPLYTLFRQHLALSADLDLCGYVYGTLGAQRSQIAALAAWVTEAAEAGDTAAAVVFERAAQELFDIVLAVRGQLQVPATLTLPVSYSGGVFRSGDRILQPFSARLAGSNEPFLLTVPRLRPAIGAALYAARCAGQQFPETVIQRLGEL